MTAARLFVRHRLAIALVWLALLALFVPLANRLEQSLSMTANGAGGDSIAVTRMLKERFHTPFAESALLAIAGAPDMRTPAGAQTLKTISNTVARVSGVAAVTSYLDAQDHFLIAEDGRSAILITGLDTSTVTAEAGMRALREATVKLAATLQSEAKGIRLNWTGDAAVNFDIRAASRAQAQSAELTALPLTLAILILVFGGVAAAMVPLAAGAMAIPLALGAATLIAWRWPMSSLLVNVVTMIGLALSIDYSLLIVERFRDARAEGLDAEDAAIEAATHAGRTVVMSGVAVAIGFGALLAIPVDELRSVAVGGLLATLAAVLIATTLTPGLLSWLGRAIEWGRFCKPRPRIANGTATRWAKFVTRHPLAVLLLAGLPVLALVSQAGRLALELPRGDWLPKTMESTRALHDLEAMGRDNLSNSIRLIVELPPGADIATETGRAPIDRLTKILQSDPRIERVTSLTQMLAGTPAGIEQLPQTILKSLVSSDRRAALIEAIPTEGVEPSNITHFVRFLRGADPEALTGSRQARLLIGGQPAFQAKYEDAVTSSFASVVGLVLAATLAVLTFAFRSVLIPLKAVALNLLSVAAGFGAVVLAFQDGYGAWLLGLSGPTGAVFPIVPPLVFCAVFGVSMDYEVFLVARIAELRKHTANERAAVADGLARTSGLITGAASVMISVFAAFAYGDFLLMKMLGFALAVTVFIDATIVRMAIGPALLTLAGTWNWWPGERRPPRQSNTALAPAPQTAN